MIDSSKTLLTIHYLYAVWFVCSTATPAADNITELLASSSFTEVTYSSNLATVTAKSCPTNENAEETEKSLNWKLIATKRTSQFVELGESTIIVCHVTQLSTVWWEYQSIIASSSTSIYNGRSKVRNSQIENYTIDSSTDADCQLISFVVLDVVQREHAGTFRCTDARDDTKKMLENELGILVTTPTCTANNTGRSTIDEYELVMMDCEVKYIGNWQPVFDCLPGTGTSSTVDDSGTLERVVRYSHLVNITRQLHDKRITCVMNYSRTDTVVVTNVTSPYSNYTWNTAPFSVTYGPDNVKMSINNNTMTCISEGNPIPNNTWFILPENKLVSNHSILDVCELDGVQSWMKELRFSGDEWELHLTCTASCNGRSISFTEKLSLKYKQLKEICEKDVAEKKPTGSPLQATGQPPVSESSSLINMTKILVATLVGTLMICGIVIAILTTMMLKRRRRQATMRPKAELPTRKKSMRSSIFKYRSSGIYDDIVEVSTARNEIETTHPYDEIPDNAVKDDQPLSYQSLNRATREGSLPYAHVGAASGPKEDDCGYTLASVGLYNEYSQSSDELGQSTGATNGIYSEPQFDTSINPGVEDSSKVVDEESTLKPLSVDAPPDTYYKNHAASQLNDSAAGAQTHKYLTLMADWDGGAGEEVNRVQNNNYYNSAVAKGKSEYCKLDQHTLGNTESLNVKEYAPLKVCDVEAGLLVTGDAVVGEQLAVRGQDMDDAGQRGYHVLDPITLRTPQADKSVTEYTRLKGNAHSTPEEAIANYHGLDAATRDAEMALPHEYASLNADR